MLPSATAADVHSMWHMVPIVAAILVFDRVRAAGGSAFDAAASGAAEWLGAAGLASARPAAAGFSKNMSPCLNFELSEG